ncbi:MAG: hypothetical protein U0573_09015 [Phycisphaerales bacterium]|nr:hypothetical protein [Planctomycetota bacterium]
MNKLLCAAALLLGGATAVADTVVINFETLAAGSTVSSQYAALGVHFSTTPATDPQGMTHAGIDVTQAPGGSFGTRSANLWTSAVIIAFDYDVTSFSVLVEDTERGSLLATARAYDAKGQLAAFASEMTGNYNGPGYYQGTLHLEAPQIRFVELRADADGAIFDNITIARVPAPGAAALLPFGLLRLARRRR